LPAFSKKFLFYVDVEILLDSCEEKGWILGRSCNDFFQYLLALQVENFIVLQEILLDKSAEFQN
jgi:hypothetical protein